MTDAPSLDAAGQLDKVERRLTVTEGGREAVPTVVTLRQEYGTDAADLWEAVTTADRLRRWFSPVSGDLRAGGRYQVEGNANGTIETCDAPHSFTATWEFGGAVTRIAVRVEALGTDRSRLTLEHSGETPREFWDQFGPGATGVGWDLGMLGLALHLETGADRPAENTAWGESDQAKAFMAGSSRRWVEAAIAAGVEPSDARAAGERTTAFYTGAAE
ncbi:SRPBCC family protein [Lysobacter korlensis]|uniref:SRPBCC family protein n=1 Tax=Lysobacter korlensis TaxID=553636 RepID=A0ABV6RVC0_9GAMM